MKRTIAAWTGILMAATAAGAFGQTPDSAASQASPPRLEVGGGFTGAVPLSPMGVAGVLALANGRVGVTISPKWAVEGAFDARPQPRGVTTFYRIQARWQFGGSPGPDGVKVHLTAGGAGSFSYWSYPAYRWQDGTGAVYTTPAGSQWNGSAPIYPTAGIGITRRLGRRVALRADVAAIIVPFYDGLAAMVMPTVGLSFPVGGTRPETSSRR